MTNTNSTNPSTSESPTPTLSAYGDTRDEMAARQGFQDIEKQPQLPGDDSFDNEKGPMGPELHVAEAEEAARAPSIRAPTSENSQPALDKGWDAWSACLAGHLVIMNTWGFIISFGVFQPYYAERLNSAPSDISWIGSVQVFLIFFMGTITGRLTDAGYFRPVLLTGVALTLLGIFTTSAGSQYWHFFLSQGVCMGIGSSCMFTPVISVISTHFKKKAALAIGLAASGSVTGGLVFPSMARQLLPRIGFGWCIRSIGLVQLVTLLVATLLIKPRIPPRKKGPFVEWSAFKELDYSFYAAGMFFSFWGLYFAFYYISAFSKSQVTPQMTTNNSLNLLLIINGVGLIGRLVPNYFADRYGALNLMAPACLLSGIAILSWIVIDTPTKLYIWSPFYGIFAGAIQNLFPAATSSLTADPSKRGTRIGMVFSIVSFAALTGSPIAGAIVTAMDGNYLGAQCFAGADLLIGTMFILTAIVVRRRRQNALAA